MGFKLIVVCGLALFRVAFDVVEQADPRQRLMGSLRVAGPGLVELSPCVHHAADLDDLARFVETIVGRIGVGLEIALEILEDLLRPGGTTVRRVPVGYVTIVVIADGNPEPTGLDPLAGVVLYGHRCVVVLDYLGRQDLALHQLHDRSQQLGGDRHQSHIVERDNSIPYRFKIPSSR